MSLYHMAAHLQCGIFRSLQSSYYTVEKQRTKICTGFTVHILPRMCHLLFFTLDELLEVLYRFLQSFFELDLGLPAGELLVGDFYVRAALGGVVGRERHVYDV